jgi:hypothetical protein
MENSIYRRRKKRKGEINKDNINEITKHIYICPQTVR